MMNCGVWLHVYLGAVPSESRLITRRHSGGRIGTSVCKMNKFELIYDVTAVPILPVPSHSPPTSLKFLGSGCMGAVVSWSRREMLTR